MLGKQEKFRKNEFWAAKQLLIPTQPVGAETVPAGTRLQEKEIECYAEQGLRRIGLVCWSSQNGDGWKMHAEKPLRAMSNAEVVGFVILVKSSMESSMTYRLKRKNGSRLMMW